MRILQGHYVVSGMSYGKRCIEGNMEITHFLNLTSATRSLPPFILSARKTFPVLAIATICECSLKGLNEIGSWISPVGLRE